MRPIGTMAAAFAIAMAAPAAAQDWPAKPITKANQARMQYGSSGAGSTVHLACSLLNAKLGVHVTHIPYRGTAPATQDMLAGRLDYMCPLSASATPQIESGQVKAIAVLAKERS